MLSLWQLMFWLFAGTTTLALSFVVPSTTITRRSPQCSITTRTTTTTTTTSIFAADENNQKQKQQRKKKKGPRFTQQAHVVRQTSSSSSSSSKNNKNGKHQHHQKNSKRKEVWQSNKSIDDLESIMIKRWGTLDGNHNNNNNNNNNNQNNHKNSVKNGRDRRRPVYDPWNNDQNNHQKGPKSSFVREFYDEDDEGFEYIEIIDDNYEYQEGDEIEIEKVDESSDWKIDHLIAPQPAGGKGSKQNVDDGKEPTGSYFFNPNAATTTKKENNNNNNNNNNNSKGGVSKNSNTNNKQLDSNNKKRKPKPAQPLLDEDGDPILLTVDEALYRFQSSLLDGDDDPDNNNNNHEELMEILERPDAVPIVARTKSMSWQDVGITNSVVLENLRDFMNCPSPLFVQEQTCPAVLTGNDVLVGTYTGSGKTLAFLVPLVEQLLWNFDDKTSSSSSSSSSGLSVLIVAPGRELASQIVSVARQLLENTPLKVQLAIGGTTFSRNLEQIRKRKPNILVGTPGRIAELVVGKPGEKSGRLKINSLQALVLDEFDALLEYKPHRDPTRAIMQALKRRHGDGLQSILCSATATDSIDKGGIDGFLRPGYVTAMADEKDLLVVDANKNKNDKNRKGRVQVSRTVLHGVVHVPHKRLALETVRRILHTEPVPQQILIFVDTARKVDIVVEKLLTMGIVAAPLHGGMGSDKMDRAEVSKALREGYVGIVVATEMAARGLDAPLLTHVINLDLPTDASHYAHRAGRCGRGGRPGVVINVTTSPKERNVPKRFAESLGIEMHSVDPRGGKLLMIDPNTQKLDP